MMCAQLGVTMSQRVVKLMETEVQHWEETGKPLDLERFDRGEPPRDRQTIAERVAAEDPEKLAKLTKIPKKRLKKIASGDALSEEEAICLSEALSIKPPEAGHGF